MDDGKDREYSRQPRPEDLAKICAALNREGARYVLIGGFAVIARGLERPTKDIDLLIDASAENIERVKAALMKLPDGAVRDVANDDLDHYVVVRVTDEIVVDLMKAACGIEYREASRMVDVVPIDGVPIPFANPSLLWRTKQTMREKDRLDRVFLAQILGDDTPHP